ncbi:homeobox protein PKNOX1 [Podospora aff. communis PSN243]|uniref:Homeobox protein PKNOX1 n=1 Tax=Podospora aff. communis PSN243 TaxID=3040156 RepID=A0AAV9GXW9_9PEZI|nr:homeobox protein PKNOX1 [Podospora aff. communis PSN243]
MTVPDPTTTTQQPPTPITIVTGFLGSGKTTLILNLLPQLRALSPHYRLALLKNEFGDLAIDSQLASSSSISSTTELLNGCICCNLVGQLSPALVELRNGVKPDRIIIETSGSAFPATLAMEVNRLARETGGRFSLDGVVSVVDVENWKGYEDTSYTARLQARYTDLVVLNKWEECGERRVDEVLDRLGDLEGVDTPTGLLKAAPREEVYRIKAVLTAGGRVRNSDEDVGVLVEEVEEEKTRRYILNWAFGRWTFTAVPEDVEEHESSGGTLLRMTMILARYESTKWKKKLESGGFLALDGGETGELVVTKIA